MPRGRDLLGREGLVLRAAGDLLGHDDVDREHDPDAVGLGGREDPPRVVDPVRLGQALADRLALGEQERVGHPAAEDEHVDLGEQVVDDLDLVRHLGPAEDRGERARRRLHEHGQHLEFALHQEAGVTRDELRHADRGGVGSMGGPEGVVDVDVRVGGQRGGELGVVLFLGGVEAQVLQQEQFARS